MIIYIILVLLALFATLAITIIFLVKDIRILKKEHIKSKGIKYNMYIIELVICIIYFIFASFIGYKLNATLFYYILIFINSFVLFLLNQYIASIANKEFKMQVEIKQNEPITEYNNNIRQLNNEYLIIKKRCISDLLQIQKYIDIKDYDGIKNYYKAYIANNDMERYTDKIGELNLIQDSTLRALLSSNIIHAFNSDLNINLNISQVVKEKSYNSLDVVRVLNILLDNAIEAATESEEKKLFISINQNDAHTVINIKNSFLDEPDINKVFKIGYSTKSAKSKDKSERGVGLYSVKKICKRNKKIIVSPMIDDNVFSITLDLICC